MTTSDGQKQYGIFIIDRKGNQELWDVVYIESLAESKESAQKRYPNSVVYVGDLYVKEGW